MGMLVDGKWEITPIVTGDKSGHFVRKASAFRHTITADGSNEFKAEPNRYHLYLSYACPWASRALMFLRLKKLENVISFSFVEPLMLDMGWEFGNDAETKDPLFGYQYLHQVYQRADAHYTGKATVPALWDKVKNTIVNNESSEIIRMLNKEFDAFTDVKVDYYPKNLRNEIDDINQFVYDTINNGVYKCGFASQQAAYDEAVVELFHALDQIEKRLSKQRYLVDDVLTEADWRLFTTLIRFDVVYYSHFKCNLHRLSDYPSLSKYLHELYQVPGIKSTVNFDHIKKHYFGSHKFLNPSGIIPMGPILNFD